jgi:hypothetical protein
MFPQRAETDLQLGLDGRVVKCDLGSVLESSSRLATLTHCPGFVVGGLLYLHLPLDSCVPVSFHKEDGMGRRMCHRSCRWGGGN